MPLTCYSGYIYKNVLISISVFFACSDKSLISCAASCDSGQCSGVIKLVSKNNSGSNRLIERFSVPKEEAVKRSISAMPAPLLASSCAIWVENVSM